MSQVCQVQNFKKTDFEDGTQRFGVGLDRIYFEGLLFLFEPSKFLFLIWHVGATYLTHLNYKSRVRASFLDQLALRPPSTYGLNYIVVKWPAFSFTQHFGN